MLGSASRSSPGGESQRTLGCCCFPSPSVFRMKSSGDIGQNDRWGPLAVPLNSHEIAGLSWERVCRSTYGLLWFSGRCLNSPFLVVSTCARFKQAPKPSLCFSPTAFWNLWKARKMIKWLTSVMGVAFFPPFPPIFTKGLE